MRRGIYIFIGFIVICGIGWGAGTLSQMKIDRRADAVAARAALTPCQMLINDIKTAYHWNLVKGYDSVADLNMAINSYIKTGGETNCEKSVMDIMNEARNSALR